MAIDRAIHRAKIAGCRMSDGGRVLELRGVTKRYGKVPALLGLDLGVERGQVYGLLGRNGAGKSTALRIVMGITRHDTGVVSLFGTPGNAGDTSARQRLGYVAQEQHFYDWMTPERLGRFVRGFYPTWDAPRFRELLRRFDVPERKIGGLSGGTKVKLALALALAHAPELLVLDEPTAGLDAVARHEFLDIVREQGVAGQHTTIFSSHLIDDVESVCQQIGIIDGGRMLFEGSLQDLSARVRRLTLPASDAGALSALTGLPIGIVQDRVLQSERRLVLWANEPDVFAVVADRVAPLQLETLALEDTFVALVRQRSESAA